MTHTHKKQSFQFYQSFRDNIQYNQIYRIRQYIALHDVTQQVNYLCNNLNAF